jgi:hypothetical protein
MRITLLLLAFTACAVAQPGTCGGLSSVTETNALVYPPLAKAAFVDGLVILLATFKTSGEVEKIVVVEGPPMLVPSATAYVQGLRANEYTGQRTCGMVVEYRGRHVACGEALGNDIFARADAQHVSLEAGLMPICDAAATVKRKRRFLIF